MTKRLAAEFLGTFWLVLGGCGSAVLAAAFPNLGIGFAGVALAFGLTVVTMAYAVGHVSGAHFILLVFSGRPRPTRLCKNVHRLGKPAALVVVLEQLQRVLATAHGKPDGTDDKRDPGDAATQNKSPPDDQSARPLRRILRHHDGTDKPSLAKGLTTARTSGAMAD